MQKAFSDESSSKKNVCRCYKQFQDGEKSVEKNVVSNRSKSSTDEQHVEEIKDMVVTSRRLTVRDFADTVGISKEPIIQHHFARCVGPQTR